MPIHEYECILNKHRFEVLQKFNEPPVTKCIICGEPVERLVSAPAIQFKGSGFYITDYARKDGKESSSKESNKESSKESSKESGAATKSADKAADTTSSASSSSSSSSSPASSSSSEKKETSTSGGSGDNK